MRYIIIDSADLTEFQNLHKQFKESRFVYIQPNRIRDDKYKIKFDRIPGGPLSIIDDFIIYLKERANFQFSY